MKLCASPMGIAAPRSVLVLTVKSRPRKTRCKRSDRLLAKPSYLVQPSRAVRRSRRTQRKWRLEVIDRPCIALLQKGRQDSRPNNFAFRARDSQDQKISRSYKKVPASEDAGGTCGESALGQKLPRLQPNKASAIGQKRSLPASGRVPSAFRGFRRPPLPLRRP
jgi:hypothetical protein